jgi:hypothetical protein
MTVRRIMNESELLPDYLKKWEKEFLAVASDMERAYASILLSVRRSSLAFRRFNRKYRLIRRQARHEAMQHGKHIQRARSAR